MESKFRDQMPEWLIPSYYRALTARLANLPNMLRGREDSFVININFSTSLSIMCRIEKISEAQFEIVMPCGIYIRLRILARMLLTHYNNKPHMRVVKSPLDAPAGPERYYMPDHFRPIFLDDEAEETFWPRMAQLNSLYPETEEMRQDIDPLLSLAYLFLYFHEYSHAYNDHHTLIEKYLKRGRFQNERTVGYSEADIYQGIEADADMDAARWLMLFLFEEFRRNETMHGFSLTAYMDRTFTRVSFAVTMLIALFDVRRKSLGDYSLGHYPHPMVRHRLIVGAWLDVVAERAEALFPEEPDGIVQFWKSREQHAWYMCIKCFDALFMDNCLNPESTKTDDIVAPLPSLSYDTNDFALSVFREREFVAVERAKRVNMLIKDIKMGLMDAVLDAGIRWNKLTNEDIMK